MKNYHTIKIYLLITFLFLSFSNAAKEEVKDWTFLIFLNANNNLDYFGDINLKQMEEIGSNKNINIVVQWGSMSRKTVKRMLIKKSTNPNQITSPVVQDIGAADMGDAKELVKFMKWGHEKYPAKKYFVSVWNHGNGWYKKAGSGGVQINDISYDDKTGNKITTEQLGLALGEFSKTIGRKVDLFGSDACLMSMVEVASEMSDSVAYFAGSQEVEPGYGWPYNNFLKEWNKNPAMEGDKVGELLATEYLKAYSGGIYGNGKVTFSILNLSFLPQFESSVKSLVGDLKTLPLSDLRQVSNLVKQTQYFTYSDYKDFAHFLNAVQSEKILSEKTAMTEAFNSLVIVNRVSDTYKDAHGISIWLPDSEWQLNNHSKRYEKLKFNERTNWLDFLASLPLN